MGVQWLEQKRSIYNLGNILYSLRIKISIPLLVLPSRFMVSDALAQKSIDQLSKHHCTVSTPKDNFKQISLVGTYCPIAVTFGLYPHHWPRYGRQNVESFVILRFTLSRIGTPINIEVLDSYYSYANRGADVSQNENIIKTSPAEVLHRPAVKAIQKFKYRPFAKDNEAIEMDNLVVKLIFPW